MRNWRISKAADFMAIQRGSVNLLNQARRGHELQIILLFKASEPVG